LDTRRIGGTIGTDGERGCGVKQYLLIRLKKRWPFLLILAVITLLHIHRSLKEHDWPIRNWILLYGTMGVVVWLCPFKLGSEYWDK
jgi:hypothetical protein